MQQTPTQNKKQSQDSPSKSDKIFLWFSLSMIVIIIIVYQFWGFTREHKTGDKIQIKYTQGQLDSLRKDSLNGRIK